MILVDLDDTLADARWREPLWGNWEEFYKEAHLDLPILPVVRMVRAMAGSGLRIVIVTAREERWRPLTVAWLVAQGIYAQEVRMRPEGDFSPSPELKVRMVEDLLEAGLVELVIDDREDVLQAFRALGIPTLRSQYGGPP